MIVRLGDAAPLSYFGAPTAADVAALPTFCDPDWTAMNGGICTDAMGNFRTSSGSTVTQDQIIHAMQTPVGAPAAVSKGSVFGVDPTALAFILGGVFFFSLILPRRR